MLSYKNPPVMKNVRWKHGQAKWVQIQPQRVFPRWLIAAVNALMLIGLGSIVYWLLRAGIYFAQQLGYVHS
jgi:hypothetical protein